MEGQRTLTQARPLGGAKKLRRLSGWLFVCLRDRFINEQRAAAADPDRAVQAMGDVADQAALEGAPMEMHVYLATVEGMVTPQAESVRRWPESVQTGWPTPSAPTAEALVVAKLKGRPPRIAAWSRKAGVTARR